MREAIKIAAVAFLTFAVYALYFWAIRKAVSK